MTFIFSDNLFIHWIHSWLHLINLLTYLLKHSFTNCFALTAFFCFCCSVKTIFVALLVSAKCFCSIYTLQKPIFSTCVSSMWIISDIFFQDDHAFLISSWAFECTTKPDSHVGSWKLTPFSSCLHCTYYSSKHSVFISY